MKAARLGQCGRNALKVVCAILLCFCAILLWHMLPGSSVAQERTASPAVRTETCPPCFACNPDCRTCVAIPYCCRGAGEYDPNTQACCGPSSDGTSQIYNFRIQGCCTPDNGKTYVVFPLNVGDHWEFHEYDSGTIFSNITCTGDGIAYATATYNYRGVVGMAYAQSTFGTAYANVNVTWSTSTESVWVGSDGCCPNPTPLAGIMNTSAVFCEATVVTNGSSTSSGIAYDSPLAIMSPIPATASMYFQVTSGTIYTNIVKMTSSCETPGEVGGCTFRRGAYMHCSPVASTRGNAYADIMSVSVCR